MGMSFRIYAGSCQYPFMSPRIKIIMRRGEEVILHVHSEVPHSKSAFHRLGFYKGIYRHPPLLSTHPGGLKKFS